MENIAQQGDKGLPSTKSIDYIKLFKIVLSRWYWMAACIILSVIITYIYLWYTPSSYSTSGSIKFEEKQNEIEGLTSKLNYSNVNKLQSETYVIQSREVLLNAIKNIDYQVSFFLKGRVRVSETYPYQPFIIDIVKQDSAGFYNGFIDFKTIDAKQFNLSWANESKNFYYNQKINLPGLQFSIPLANVPDEAAYSFKFNKPEDFLMRISSGLNMREAAKGSNVLLISIIDRNGIFAADVLNALMKEYIFYDLQQKQISANQTIEFINQQLNFITQKVYESGTQFEQFKEVRSISNIKNQTDLVSGKLKELDNKLSEIKYKLIGIEQLEALIKNNKSSADYNLNLEGELSLMLVNLLFDFNNLITLKQKSLKKFNENTEPIAIINKEIAALKNSIFKK